LINTSFGDGRADTAVFRGKRLRYTVTPMNSDASEVIVRRRGPASSSHVTTLLDVERILGSLLPHLGMELLVEDDAHRVHARLAELGRDRTCGDGVQILRTLTGLSPLPRLRRRLPLDFAQNVGKSYSPGFFSSGAGIIDELPQAPVSAK
jgi:hypothetical protein